MILLFLRFCAYVSHQTLKRMINIWHTCKFFHPPSPPPPNEAAAKLPQLNIIEDPWKEIAGRSVEWNQNIPMMDEKAPLLRKNIQVPLGSY